eukprot:m.198750 g.198750  ORF g.198750 m.198750 type:complete len:424 (+) comp39562_c0_seq55:869-2140(+)
MVMNFKILKTVDIDVSPTGAAVESDFFSLTVPAGAISAEEKNVRLGFTIYTFDEATSEGVQETVAVTDLLVLHPCGATFRKEVAVKFNHTVGSLDSNSSIILFYEPPNRGSFLPTWVPYQQDSYFNIEGATGMKSRLHSSSIQIDTLHFCKFFACIFGCRGHVFRVLAFERPGKENSKTIDVHFTSCREKYVNAVKSCCKGLTPLVNSNATLHFSRLHPTQIVINSVSPGWTRTTEDTFRSILDSRELKKAKSVPEKFCTRTLILERDDENALRQGDEELRVVIHIKGGETDSWLVLQKLSDDAAASLLHDEPQASLDRQLTGREIVNLSRLVCSHWQSIARLLTPKLPHFEIIRISRFYDGDVVMQAEKMLDVWVTSHGRMATARSLCIALLEQNLKWPVEKVFGKGAIEMLARKPDNFIEI